MFLDLARRHHNNCVLYGTISGIEDRSQPVKSHGTLKNKAPRRESAYKIELSFD
jgi:hypothetical protein